MLTMDDIVRDGHPILRKKLKKLQKLTKKQNVSYVK